MNNEDMENIGRALGKTLSDDSEDTRSLVAAFLRGVSESTKVSLSLLEE